MIMINEKFYDEIKEHFIENISDTFTLNLAIMLCEDSRKYRVDSDYYKQALNEIRDYVNSDKLLKIFCEPKINLKGETYFDLIRNDITQIIDNVLLDE